MKRILLILLALIFTGCAANHYQGIADIRQASQDRINHYLAQPPDSLSWGNKLWLIESENCVRQIQERVYLELHAK